MQPLDRAFFKPLRDHVQQVIDTDFPTTRPDETHVAGIFAKAYARMVPVPHSSKLHPLKSGFASTGLVPFNPRPFTDADFAPSDVFLGRTGASSPVVRARELDPTEIATKCSKAFDATSPVIKKLAEHNAARMFDPLELLFTDDRVIEIHLAKQKAKADEAASKQKRKEELQAKRAADAAEKSAKKAAKAAEQAAKKAAQEAEKEAKRVATAAAKEERAAAKAASKVVKPHAQKRARGPAHVRAPPVQVDLDALREHDEMAELNPSTSGRKRRAPLKLME
jgi:chemotaxis protein histidine kinase CheA